MLSLSLTLSLLLLLSLSLSLSLSFSLSLTDIQRHKGFLFEIFPEKFLLKYSIRSEKFSRNATNSGITWLHKYVWKALMAGTYGGNL